MFFALGSSSAVWRRNAEHVPGALDEGVLETSTGPRNGRSWVRAELDTFQHAVEAFIRASGRGHRPSKESSMAAAPGSSSDGVGSHADSTVSEASRRVLQRSLVA